jgi:predicted phosphodiesterase
MKILVLSDIHYPISDSKLIKRILLREKPQKLVLLGDIINDKGYAKKFFSLIPKRLKKQTYFVQGDEDRVKADYDMLKLEDAGKKFIFIHGHQFNVMHSEKTTYFLATVFKLFNYALPLFAFALKARKKLALTDEYLFLGHSHGLKRFKSIKTICCGTLSNLDIVYKDKGYVVISDGKIELKTTGGKPVI